MDRTRRVKVYVPNFFAAVEIAARSDLVVTLRASLGRIATLDRGNVTVEDRQFGPSIVSRLMAPAVAGEIALISMRSALMTSEDWRLR